MKNVVLLLAMGLLVLGACYANGNLASEPVSGGSAASQQRSADNALLQAQQQQDSASAAAVQETAEAQAVDNARAFAAAATAQVIEAARVRVVLTSDAQALLVAQQQAQATATIQAQLAQQAAQSIEAKATVDARAVLLAQQQVQAKATVDAQAVLLAQQQSQATATTQAQFAQQAAQSIEAKATVDARAVLLVQQQAQATATAEGLQRDGLTSILADSNTRVQGETMAWLIPIGAAAAFGLVLVLGAKYFGGLIDRANDRRLLENQKLALITTLFKTPTETMVFIDEAAPPPRLTPPAVDGGDDPNADFASLSTAIDAEAPPAIVILSNGDPQLPDRAEIREAAARYKLAMRLLRDAINHTQLHANRIPSALQLGWPAKAWAIAVAILRPYGVETLQGSEGGTYLVGQYPTLQALYIALGEIRMNLYPPKAEGVPSL